MAARSTGIFPVRGAYVDNATVIPAGGGALTVPDLGNSSEVTFVAFFSADAAGSVEVTAGATTFTIAAEDQKDGKVLKVRSGYELGSVTSVTQDQANLSAGTCQVSIF